MTLATCAMCVLVALSAVGEAEASQWSIADLGRGSRHIRSVDPTIPPSLPAAQSLAVISVNGQTDPPSHPSRVFARQRRRERLDGLAVICSHLAGCEALD